MPDILPLATGFNLPCLSIVFRGNLGIKAQPHSVQDDLSVAYANIHGHHIGPEKHLPLFLRKPVRKSSYLYEIITRPAADQPDNYILSMYKRCGNFIHGAVAANAHYAVIPDVGIMLRQFGGMTFSFSDDYLCIEPVYGYQLPYLIYQCKGKAIPGYRVDNKNPLSLLFHGRFFWVVG